VVAETAGSNSVGAAKVNSVRASKASGLHKLVFLRRTRLFVPTNDFSNREMSNRGGGTHDGAFEIESERD